VAFLSSEHIKRISSAIDPFDETNIKHSSYELSLGNEVYITNSPDGKKEILNDENSQVEIQPGQFALLLTKEKIKVPLDKMALISVKASLKFKGLVNISGFHVDPGFVGKLIFSVYNAGNSTILLERSKPYFIIWFSELTSESEPYNGQHKELTSITAAKIENLKGELASPNELLKKIDKVDGKKDRNLSWLRLAVGLLLTINAGFLLDRYQYTRGYEAGLKETSAKKEVKEAMKEVDLEKVIQFKLDSILNTKNVNLDSGKSQ